MKWPEMQVDAIEGRFLKMLVRLTGARTVLELGMFTGYSSLRVARPDCASDFHNRRRSNGFAPWLYQNVAKNAQGRFGTGKGAPSSASVR
jgi:hypothetical protein